MVSFKKPPIFPPIAPARKEKKLLENATDLKTRILESGGEALASAIEEAVTKNDSEAVSAFIDIIIRERRLKKTIDPKSPMYVALEKISYTPEQIERVIEMAKSSDMALIESALDVITSWRDPKALPQLIELLKHREWKIRSDAGSTIDLMAASGVDCSSAKEPLFNAMMKEGRSLANSDMKCALKSIGVSEEEIKRRTTDHSDQTIEFERDLAEINNMVEEKMMEIERIILSITGSQPELVLAAKVYAFWRRREEEWTMEEAVRKYFEKIS